MAVFEFGDFTQLNARSLSKLIALDKLHFKRAWSDLAWQQACQVGSRYFAGIISEGDVVHGFSLFDHVSNFPCVHLLKILIMPDARKKGAGKQLLEQTLINLKQLGATQCFLEVEADNSSAIKLYIHCGFKQLHLAKDFYGQGQDALKMLKAGL